MSFRIVYREAGIQTTDETGVGSEASFNVGDAERDGLCTPSSTVSAGEKYTKVTRVPTAQSIKYPSTGIVHAPGPSIPAISYSTVPGGFPSSFPATSSSTLDGSNRTDHLQAQGPGTLAFQVPNVVSAQSQATSAAVLEYPGVVNTFQSQVRGRTSVADPFHFDPDPRIRFVEKRIWIRPKIEKIQTFL